MVVLENALRALDLILVMMYFPVLVARFRSNDQQHRLYLVGVLFILLSIITSSILAFGTPFRGVSAFMLVGMGCIWWESVLNIRRERQKT